MNDALHAAASAMASRMRSLDVSTKNMVNSMTPGYMKRQLSVNSFATTLDKELNREASMVGGEESIAWVQGRMMRSEDPLSVAIHGEGFFVVQLPDGGRGFTRNGDFTVGPDGTLQTRAGYPILGENGPLQANVDGAPPFIGADGSFMQGNEVIGRVSLVEFQNRNALTELSDTIWTADPAAGEMAAEDSKAMEGFLEMSHESGMSGMVAMMVAGHQFESAKNAMRIIDDSYQRLHRNQ